jgi:hypothetical protein
MRRDGGVEVERALKFFNGAVGVRLIIRVTGAAPYPEQSLC